MATNKGEVSVSVSTMAGSDEFGIDYSTYWPVSHKISAKLFTTESDFIVQEIFDGKIVRLKPSAKPSIIKSKRSAHLRFTMLKKGISTFDAAKQISTYFNVPESDVWYCGLKDTYAITAQKVSVPIRKGQELYTYYGFENFLLFDGSIVDKQLTANSHSGNHFIITVHPVSTSSRDFAALHDRLLFLKANGIPNYYGPQRFGSRKNGYKIGKKLLQRDFEGAAKMWLTGKQETWAKGALIAKNWGNWDESLAILESSPEAASEIRFMTALAEGMDFKDAFASIPLGPFFIRAYRSYLFNRVLTALSRHSYSMKEDSRLEVVGWDSKLTGEVGEIYGRLLKQEKIELDDFKFDDMPKFTQNGYQRDAFYGIGYAELDRGKDGSLILSFSLHNGSYASILLGILFDYEYPEGIASED